MYIKHFRYLHISISILLIIAQIYCYGNNNLNREIVFEKDKSLTNIASDNIKSVKIYKTGFELNQPIIELGSEEKITLEFDDISAESEQYEYTVIHCNYNWEPTGLSFMEFAEGFEFNPIYDYSYSSGTLIQYRHFSLELPNSEIKFKISGNYIIKIVKQGNHEGVVLQQRFKIHEPLVKINMSIRQPVSPNIQKTHQQLELNINTSAIGRIDPNNDIKVLVQQNNQSYNQLLFDTPLWVDGNTLIYSNATTPTIEGGNEYRQINLKSFHYQSSKIIRMLKYDGVYQTILASDYIVKSYRYIETQDINGKYLIKCDDVTNSKVEADYSWVYFTLSTEQMFDGDIYLFGELTGWEINPKYKLNFNPQNQSYEAKLLLKQGYYNYKYVFVSRDPENHDFNRIESSFFDTENSYTTYVYYKSPGVRYWRLVGVKGVSSRFKE